MTNETQQQQHEDNQKVNKKINFSININSVLTTVFGLAIMAISSCGWNEIKGLHDAQINTEYHLNDIDKSLAKHDTSLQKIWDTLSSRKP